MQWLSYHMETIICCWMPVVISLNSNSMEHLVQDVKILIISVQSVKPGSVAAVCPSNLEIIFGYSSQAVLVTFQYGQTEGQQLSYMKSNARDIACGQNNLVTLDNANYLAFNTYNIVDSKILGWVIAVIVIAIILFIALIVTIVYCICKKRK